MKAATAELQLLVVMSADATAEEVDEILARLEDVGADSRVTPGQHGTIIGAIGDRESLVVLDLESCAGVDRVMPVARPHKLVARETSPDPTLIQVRGRRIGRGYFALIAGPGTVESRQQALEAARVVHAAGATMLCGTAFEPAGPADPFHSLGSKALQILEEAREETGLPLVTELVDPRDVGAVAEAADIIQIGARSMQNFTLLSEVGKCDKPVLLRRAPSASVAELLMAAEYVAKEGNPRVLLCERGIRTFERSTRYTLDISAVPVLKEETHLPVIVDPSRAAGRPALVPALACAAIAAGADGIMVEVHPAPEHALWGADHLLPAGEFAALADRIRGLLAAVGKIPG